ncbi:hypothetical protein AALO_G00254240 [Alosa alosa]|uniref:Zinc finger and BTB domain-containing protein 22-like n=1 Tax=Alosa alosa TaxID=278164 RepID=A0AAV6FRW3_9TELE|nr:zinc finger and BTB domain-containing protein 22 [Alosa alosa]XP_048085029.1 zinc finger and BTB domain-containing protein 22 [Alosa alosa]XP_048085030.1 zinc finger and BTB domain-containing protein 22 [Alosa alosa]KAG5264482.1 hypothetical protein AALO_G00254240 [Alosa alosa]
MDRVCRGATAPSGTAIQVCFPDVQGTLLEKLNQQREDGMLCDLSIHVQGQVFKAHRCVLAASSPYFHDQVLLKNVTTVSLPSVMDPLAFQSVLSSAYTGQLSIVREDIVNYVTVASFLQMWHIVDKCTEVLKQVRPPMEPSPVEITPPHGGSSRHQSPSSSDCYYVDPDDKGREKGRDCISSLEKGSRGMEQKGPLPPLATWRRPHLTSRWRARASPQPPESFSQPPPLASGSVFSPEHSEDLSASEGVSIPGGSGHHNHHTGPYGQHMGRGLETVPTRLEGLADPSHLRERARSKGAATSRRRHPSWDREGREDGGLQESQSGGERGIEADEGVGEGLVEEATTKTQRTQRSGDYIPSTALLEARPEAPEKDEGESRSHIGLPNTAEDCPPLPCGSGLCPAPPAQEQWQASPWLQQRDYRREEDDEVDEDMDFEQLGEGVFGGETYDEIEDGTGQVSQRPLLPSPDDGQFISGQSDHSWVGGGGGGGGSPSSTPFHPSASPPIPSSSSPQPNAAGPYTGRLHFCHCGKAYTLKSMRDRHVKMQHLNLRPFSCPVCSKSFKMKHHLTKHLKTHGSVRPYECSLCGKKVVWRDSFLRHQARCERLARAGMAATGDDGADVGDDGYVPQDGDGFLSDSSHVKVEKMDFNGDEVPCMDGLDNMAFLSGGDSVLATPGKTLDGHVLKQEEGERFS